MSVNDVQIQCNNGRFNVSLSVRHSDVRVEEFEGTGDTLAEAIFDLGDYLQDAKL